MENEKAGAIIDARTPITTTPHNVISRITVRVQAHSQKAPLQFNSSPLLAQTRLSSIIGNAFEFDACIILTESGRIPAPIPDGEMM